MRGTRHARERILRCEARDFLLERKAPFHRARLARCPGADLTVLRTRREIGVRLLDADRDHRPPHTHLALERLPVEAQGRLRITLELLALGAFEIGVEDEAAHV